MTSDPEVIFDIPGNSSFFCYTKCRLYSNTTETIYINKEDQDKTQFILNVFGSNCTDKTKPFSIRLSSPKKNVTIENKCSIQNYSVSRDFLKCDLKDLTTIEGGDDEDKPNSYKVQFIANRCNNSVYTNDTNYTDTQITVNVVSSSIVKLQRVAFIFFLMLFL